MSLPRDMSYQLSKQASACFRGSAAQSHEHRTAPALAQSTGDTEPFSFLLELTAPIVGVQEEGDDGVCLAKYLFHYRERADFSDKCVDTVKKASERRQIIR